MCVRDECFLMEVCVVCEWCSESGPPCRPGVVIEGSADGQVWKPYEWFVSTRSKLALSLTRTLALTLIILTLTLAGGTCRPSLTVGRASSRRIIRVLITVRAC